MKAWLKFSASLFLAQLVTFQALAANVGYELEVIIFEDTSGLYEYAEQWPTMQDVTDIAEASPMAAETDQLVQKNIGKPNQYQLLKPENYRLNSQAEKLAKHPDYRVLIHAAWKQPGLDKDQAFAVPLDTLRAKTPQLDDKQPTSTVTTDNNSRVTGDITLIMSRYLHINADLLYQKPLSQSTNSTASYNFNNQPATETDTVVKTFDTIPVLFERRMRSREMHYLDHPMIGMIVLATPFKIEPESPDARPASNYKTL